MMIFIQLLALLCLQFVMGRGLLYLLKVKLFNSYCTAALSVLAGVAIASIVPFGLELCRVPITFFSVYLSLFITTLLFAIPVFINYSKPVLKVHIKLYELPFMAVIATLLFVTSYKCYNNPVLARDALSGPELMAKLAVKEKKFANSIYSLDLSSTISQYKSPFFYTLQVIYRFAGNYNGTMWLCFITLSFFVFMYFYLRATIHPLLAGVLVIFLITIPEFFAYTNIALYDFSNAVYFFFCCLFLFLSFKTGTLRWIYVAAVFSFFACYIRVETPALSSLLFVSVVPTVLKSKNGFLQLLKLGSFFIGVSLLPYVLINSIYYAHYLPISYNFSALNPHLADIGLIWKALNEIFNVFIFSDLGFQLWSYTFYILLTFFALEVLSKKRFSKNSLFWLYSLVSLIFGLAVLGYLFPLSLSSTFKRSLFKIFPPMILYFSYNPWLLKLSKWLTEWEMPRKLLVKQSVDTKSRKYNNNRRRIVR